MRQQACVCGAVLQCNQNFSIHINDLRAALCPENELNHPDQPRGYSEKVKKVFYVQQNNYPRGCPCEDFYPERVDERPHFLAITSEDNQRDDSKGQLKAENYLAQDQQTGRAACTVKDRYSHCGNDSDHTGDQSTEPRTDPNVEE